MRDRPSPSPGSHCDTRGRRPGWGRSWCSSASGRRGGTPPRTGAELCQVISIDYNLGRLCQADLTDRIYQVQVRLLLNESLSSHGACVRHCGLHHDEEAVRVPLLVLQHRVVPWLPLLQPAPAREAPDLVPTAGVEEARWGQLVRSLGQLKGPGREGLTSGVEGDIIRIQRALVWQDSVVKCGGSSLDSSPSTYILPILSHQHLWLTTVVRTAPNCPYQTQLSCGIYVDKDWITFILESRLSLCMYLIVQIRKFIILYWKNIKKKVLGIISIVTFSFSNQTNIRNRPFWCHKIYFSRHDIIRLFWEWSISNVSVKFF